MPNKANHNRLSRVVLSRALMALAMLSLALVATRKLIGKHSVVFFAWYYLDITLPLHQELWAHAFMKARRIVGMMPRSHGKTTVLSYVLVVHRICYNRNIRILMVTATKPLARKNSMLIRSTLVNNAKLINDFGAFYHHKQSAIWTQAAWQVVRNAEHKDPTLEAVGLYGTITGGRFDWIIFDDLIDPKLVTTPEVIQKVKEEVYGTYIPLLEPNGQATAIGTRKNFNDIYGSFLKNKAWTAIVQKAIIRYPDKWHIDDLKEPYINEDGYEVWEKVVIEGKDRGKVLWADRIPIEKLLLLQKEMGSVLFEREYQNNVVDEATALFPMKFMEQCTDENMSWIKGRVIPAIRRKYTLIMIGVDPSLVIDEREAKKTDSDYFVQIAIGLTERGERHLLAIERFRGRTPVQKEKAIERFYRRVKSSHVMIEQNAFGIIYTHNLIEETDIPLVPHVTSLNKKDPYEGVPHLSGLFENMKFRLPYKTKEDQEITDSLIEEFHSFGSSIHDDQVMAVWICCYGILRYLAGQANIRKAKKSRDAQNKRILETENKG